MDSRETDAYLDQSPKGARRCSPIPLEARERPAGIGTSAIGRKPAEDVRGATRDAQPISAMHQRLAVCPHAAGSAMEQSVRSFLIHVVSSHTLLGRLLR